MRLYVKQPPKWVIAEAKKFLPDDRQHFLDFLCSYYSVPKVTIEINASKTGTKFGHYVSRVFWTTASYIYLKQAGLDLVILMHEFCHHLEYHLSGRGEQDYNEVYASAWADEFMKRLG